MSYKLISEQEAKAMKGQPRSFALHFTHGFLLRSDEEEEEKEA